MVNMVYLQNQWIVYCDESGKPDQTLQLQQVDLDLCLIQNCSSLAGVMKGLTSWKVYTIVSGIHSTTLGRFSVIFQKGDNFL